MLKITFAIFTHTLSCDKCGNFDWGCIVFEDNFENFYLFNIESLHL